MGHPSPQPPGFPRHPHPCLSGPPDAARQPQSATGPGTRHAQVCSRSTRAEICAKAGLPSGTIHPILARLEKIEWLESRWEDADPTPTRTPQAPLLPAQPGRRRTCPPGSSPRCGNHHGTPPPAPRHCLWWRSVTATKADTAQRLIGTIENLRRLAQADSCPNDLMIQIMSITDDFSKWLKIGNSGIELSHHTLTLLNRLAQLTRPNPLDLPVLEKRLCCAIFSAHFDTIFTRPHQGVPGWNGTRKSAAGPDVRRT